MHEAYTLAWYSERVPSYSLGQLQYVIREVNDTLPRFESDAERHPTYIAKLYAELDSARTELQRRVKRDKLTLYVIDSMAHGDDDTEDAPAQVTQTRVYAANPSDAEAIFRAMYHRAICNVVPA